ncbi:unnamed protein product [Closterium sp. NIES-53]
MAPMPLKPQRPPCFDPSQRGGPTVQSWVFTMNVFFDANYVESDAAKIRYAVSMLRGPAVDWWLVIVTSPRAYEPPSQEDGPTGPAITWSSFYGTAQYSTWDAWCAGLRARFKPIAASISARQKLRTWRKLGSVQDYTSGFLALCEQVGYMHEAERVDRYVGGLKPDISHSPESSTVHVNAITMKRAVAAGADLYAVDIAIVEEADKPSDFQKLLEALPSELQDLLKRFPGIFPDDLPEGLPPQRAHDHRIELEPGAQPTIQRQFRLTQPELDKLRKLLYYLLEKKFIRPSSSPFAAPILFTPKNDGGFRMCIDYRALNRVTVKSRYPISRADELIDQLRTARVFSKIDLRGGYHQIRVESSDCAKTTFRTRYGSFEYTVMPFGMTNAPATFQMTMNEAFRPLVDKCVIIYLDDILVYSRDKQQHLDDLEAVFTILDKHRLLTKGSKCEFFWGTLFRSLA